MCSARVLERADGSYVRVNMHRIHVRKCVICSCMYLCDSRPYFNKQVFFIFLSATQILPHLTSMSLLESAKNHHGPSTWGYMSPGTEVDLVELTKGSQEYRSVLSGVDFMFQVRFPPRKVVRVQNPYLWGCYLLKKAEYKARSSVSVTEKVLYHVTAKSNINSITTNNLDWRRSVRTKFGCGVSFSPSASYADTYCNRSVGRDRAIVVAKVLVGRSQPGGYCTVLPTEGFDTTEGNSLKVYVKYCDHEFYPEYVIYYER
jgi:Poly(ADP-ribose) polymerase catalytic domain.